MSDKGQWTNQNLSFTRALGDMLDLAKVIAKGALLRDECRGAHYKPAFEIPAPKSDDRDALQREAREWCRAYFEQNRKWLKTTLARYTADGPEIDYEPVDTSLIPPRPRTYGVRGAEVIEQIWKSEFSDKPLSAETAAPKAAAAAR